MQSGQEGADILFQFLIGKVKMLDVQNEKKEIKKFQFLIGKVKMERMSLTSCKVRSFNSS